MAEFFFDFGLFALKALVLMLLVGLTLGLVVAAISALVQRQGQFDPERLEIVKANDRLRRERETIEHALLDSAAQTVAAKRRKAEHKKEQKEAKRLARGKAASSDAPARRVFVVDFEGDLQASAVGSLRRALTAILTVARPEDEVVVRLESGGGLVHSYGLGASQLRRVVDQGVQLTVCVDKVAASGGYMMACVANQILAAPFAVVGSIGVVAQLPNFHRLLKKNDVDFELFTAGEHKRTITLFGENTEQGRDKFRRDLEDTHALFKEFVAEHRPDVDLETVATGEVWFGRRALERGLVDRLTTSDEYLASACDGADVLEVRYVHKKSLQERISESVEVGVDRVIGRWWQRSLRPF